MRPALVKQESTGLAPKRAMRVGYRAGMPTREIPRRNMLIARNVKSLREALGWTQQQLVDRSGVSNVKMIEAGRRYPRPANQRKLARTLNVAIWRLHLDLVGDMPVPESLQQLMNSPVGQSITTEERSYLLALPSMLGRRLSYEAYWKALEMIRSSSPDPDAVHEGDNDDDDSDPGPL